MGHHAQVSDTQQLLPELSGVRRSDASVPTRQSPQKLAGILRFGHRQLPHRQPEGFSDSGLSRVYSGVGGKIYLASLFRQKQGNITCWSDEHDYGRSIILGQRGRRARCVQANRSIDRPYHLHGWTTRYRSRPASPIEIKEQGCARFRRRYDKRP